MKKWIKAKKVLNILLGSSVGIYVGMVLWRVLDYLMNKDRYMSYSAPWYTSIIVISIFWGIVLVIEVVAWLIVRHKLTAGPEIGYLERKE